MSLNTKISFYWLFIAIGLVIQANVELMGKVYFSPNDHKAATDGIPIMVHVLFLISMIIPIIFSFVNTVVFHKAFNWISFVYAALLLIVNGYHFIGDGVSDLENISKIVILLFVFVVNIFLVLTLLKAIRRN